MKKTFVFTFVIFSSVLLTAFTYNKQKTAESDMVGFWVTGDPAVPHTFHMKVFEKGGDYYNVAFENGETIMSHKGKYEIVNNNQYSEHVTELWSKAVWDLRGKKFINHYKFSEDKKKLFLSGVVFSKDGKDSLKWAHTYRRVEVPGAN